VDNFVWKLRFVLNGDAFDMLLDIYASEREYAADENIRNSTRATDFITPKSPVSRLFRDATLRLAKDCPFARRMANSGRLSVPAVLHDSLLNTADREGDVFFGSMVTGAVCTDAPVRIDGEAAWLLGQTGGGAFTGVYFCASVDAAADCAGRLATLEGKSIPMRTLIVVPRGAAIAPLAGMTVLEDVDGVVAQRFDARPGTFYLLRPDQHVCARWRAFDAASVAAAIQRATCNG
jgi:3-(3-hydroxy-phenyl)propionate hydroxylase